MQNVTYSISNSHTQQKSDPILDTLKKLSDEEEKKGKCSKDSLHNAGITDSPQIASVDQLVQ